MPQVSDKLSRSSPLFWLTLAAALGIIFLGRRVPDCSPDPSSDCFLVQILVSLRKEASTPRGVDARP